MLERALAIAETTYGPDHQYVVAYRRDLATLG
jgi:hypothetical protein